MKLLLFDIDGTLIRSRGGGRMALASALEKVFGTAGPVENYRMDGKTDPRIITDLLTAAGIDANEIEAKLPDAYRLMVEKAKEIYPQKGMSPCPGVLPLLAELKDREDVILGLLTGNINTTSPLKLAAAGIEPEQFLVGAYGSDAMDRNQLPAIAINRAHRLTGLTFAGNNTVIIGDTPADILCARAGEATAIAVASGWHSEDTLAKYQPDHIFNNLVDTTKVIKILLGSEIE